MNQYLWCDYLWPTLEIQELRWKMWKQHKRVLLLGFQALRPFASRGLCLPGKDPWVLIVITGSSLTFKWRVRKNDACGTVTAHPLLPCLKWLRWMFVTKIHRSWTLGLSIVFPWTWASSDGILTHKKKFLKIIIWILCYFQHCWNSFKAFPEWFCIKINGDLINQMNRAFKVKNENERQDIWILNRMSHLHGEWNPLILSFACHYQPIS